jgi:23S rRNA (guanosine2251-2'-O)-methyltransferase
VSKASAGALEGFKQIYWTSSLPRFLSESKKNFWSVYGTSLEAKSALDYEMRISGPTILVLGNEGEGMSDKVSKLCDELYLIPGESNVESLNVGVAAGILIRAFG